MGWIDFLLCNDLVGIDFFVRKSSTSDISFCFDKLRMISLDEGRRTSMEFAHREDTTPKGQMLKVNPKNPKIFSQLLKSVRAFARTDLSNWPKELYRVPGSI